MKKKIWRPILKIFNVKWWDWTVIKKILKKTKVNMC